MSNSLTDGWSDSRQARLREVLATCLLRQNSCEAVSDAQIIADNPDLMPELAGELAKLHLIHAAAQRASLEQEPLGSLISNSDNFVFSKMVSESVVDRPVSNGVAMAHDESGALPEIPDYRIVRELHSGGQGVVYEAVQLSTRRTVALKLLLDGPGASRRSQQRFEREIELVASFHHPNIVTIHDSGITRGQYYYAMDYVRGQPLDTHIRLTQPDLRTLMRLFKEICDAVGYAHRMGVIHRDLKPSNILVDMEGRPVVLDFGLARVSGLSDHASLTMPGVLLGTVPYMSPEQTLGKPEGIDTRSDVYSLAVILFELVTNTSPYMTNGLDLAKAFDNIRNVDAPRPSKWSKQVTSEIDAIVLKAMDKDPNRRYGSAGEMSDDIAAWLEGRAVQAKSASSIYVLRKLVVKHGFETLALTSLLLILGSAMTQIFQSYRKAQVAQAAHQQTVEALGNQIDINAAAQRFVEPALRWLKLEWFLNDWRKDNLTAATTTYATSTEGSEERAIMSFLLNENQSIDQLLAVLPSDAKTLGYYAVGERELKAGRTAEALVAFQQSSDAIVPNSRYAMIMRNVTGMRIKQNRPGAASAPARLSAGPDREDR